MACMKCRELHAHRSNRCTAQVAPAAERGGAGLYGIRSSDAVFGLVEQFAQAMNRCAQTLLHAHARVLSHGLRLKLARNHVSALAGPARRSGGA